MISVAVLSFLAVMCSTWSSNAFPLYSDTPLEAQEDLLGKLVEEVEESQSRDAGESRGVKSIYPLLLDQGEKQSFEQEKISNMVDGLKEVVMKLAAANKLRSQGFTRSDQSLPKNNKRACFWKYCVTN
ncbi:urotensin-related peptide 1 [Alosa pseudoharengus]|uniref:urotensin-related peptide 1 n=1 Tax=Alosa pseudoharengus TaxID=34774 RepID=UPI003F8B4EC7